jgi:hypothetical protein
MLTPGLVVDDRVHASGKVLNVEQIKAILQDAQEARP